MASPAEKRKETAVVFLVLSIIGFWLGDRFGMVAAKSRDLVAGALNASDKIFSAIAHDPAAFSIEPTPLCFALGFFALVWCAWAAAFAMPKNTRYGEEHGSARWGSRSEGRVFLNLRSPDDNILLTESFGIATRRDDFDLRHDRNMNVAVIGGSGSGKTRYFVKPNLMQLYGNYFLTDPKGTTPGETAWLFEEAGYDIKVFDLVSFNSMRINPLSYVKTDAQILSFVKCLIANTNGKKPTGGNDKFWEDAETLLYVALIAFLRDWIADPGDYTLNGLQYLLSLAKASDDDEDFKSALDFMFLQVEHGKKLVKDAGCPTATGPQAKECVDFTTRGFRSATPAAAPDDGPFPAPRGFHWEPTDFRRNYDGYSPGENGGIKPTADFALSNYNAFKTGAGKTLKSIIISCNVRMKPMQVKQVSELLSGALDEGGKPTGKCELELDRLGDPDHKQIIYVCPSDTDKTLSFLFAIVMWQAIDVLCNKALSDYGGKLPTFVNFIFDEFANIGTLPDIDQTIAVTRSRNIGISIILQSVAQLNTRYDKDAAQVILDNCDTTLFLGGKSSETNKQISDQIGQETIDMTTFNQSKGQNPSYTINHQTQGRALMDQAEVGQLPGDEAIVLIRGAKPLRDRKYPPESHRRYALIDPGHKGAGTGSWRFLDSPSSSSSSASPAEFPSAHAGGIAHKEDVPAMYSEKWTLDGYLRRRAERMGEYAHNTCDTGKSSNVNNIDNRHHTDGVKSTSNPKHPDMPTHTRKAAYPSTPDTSHSRHSHKSTHHLDDRHSKDMRRMMDMRDNAQQAADAMDRDMTRSPNRGSAAPYPAETYYACAANLARIYRQMKGENT